jgi:adenine deaminase
MGGKAVKPLRELIEVAGGLRPADLAVCETKVFNVFTGEFTAGDVLVTGGHVAAILQPGSEEGRLAGQVVDGAGRWLVPGFIDAHAHMESSLLRPEEFTALSAANGVTTVIADPHELCNVMGLDDGLEYLLAATEKAPAETFFLLPSCVPASDLEAGARRILAGDIQAWLGNPRVLGLGEMMNYPGVLRCNAEVMAKLEAVQAYNEAAFGPLAGLRLDGHAPLVLGRDLQAYAATGLSSDHESSTPEEARQRLAAGMGLMLREGSGAKNLLDLLPAIGPSTIRQCMLCTDDKHAADLAAEGGVNASVRLLAADGRLLLEDILRMAGYNAARHFGLRDVGAIAPGWRADFALYGDLTGWRPDKVWNRGRLVAEGGRPVRVSAWAGADKLRNSVRLGGSVGPASLRVADAGKPVRVIGAVPGQILTLKEQARLPAREGFLQADPERDIAKLAVFERHQASGRVGLGFVRGLGLRRGALASTVAHDSHNLIVLGLNDEDMLLATEKLRECGGGQIACLAGQVLALLPFPLAGLFSDLPAAEVLAGQRALREAAKALGSAQGLDPFMNLAFLSLAVIPSLKLTDKGLVDVDAFAHVSLEIGSDV